MRITGCSYSQRGRTKISTFPDGLFQYGGQPVGPQFSSPWATAYFVDGVNGANTLDGLKPTQAKKTIDAAVQLMGRGDILYVRPNAYTVGSGFDRFTEEVTTDLAQSDLSIIGVSNSINPEYGVRMRWAGAAGYALTCHGPAIHVENIGFLMGTTATGNVLLEQNGATNTYRGIDGATFYNCAFKGGKLLANCGGDGLTIKNCRFHGSDDCIVYEHDVDPARRLTVEYCSFQNNNGTAPARAYIQLLGGAITEVKINACTFETVATDTMYIYATGTNKGIVSNCYFAHADIALDSAVVGGGIIATTCYDHAGICGA